MRLLAMVVLLAVVAAAAYEAGLRDRLGIGAALGIGPRPATSEAEAAAPHPGTGTSAERVERVVDGDTVVMADGTRIRIVGINTPEKGEDQAEEAARWMREHVLGRPVELKVPVGRRDAYGRVLGDLVADGRSVREGLLEAGLAHVMLIPPYEAEDAERLLAAESRARGAGLGIWSSPRFRGPLHVTAAASGRTCHVRVANVSGRPMSLAGYVVRAGDAGLSLPDAMLPPGRTVLVQCGEGADKAGHGPGQVVVHWPAGEHALTAGAEVEVAAATGAVVDRSTVK